MEGQYSVRIPRIRKQSPRPSHNTVSRTRYRYIKAHYSAQGALFPPETRRCTRLVSRSPTVREHWLVHPLIKQLTSHFLSKTTHCWYNDERHEYTLYPILSSSMTLECNPGGAGQRLHRDEKIHHAWRDDQTQTGYRMGSDVMMAFLVPGTQTTPENGATVVSTVLLLQLRAIGCC